LDNNLSLAISVR